jgi:molybdopterin converting factor subunit 1
MIVRVRLFARCRDLAGADSVVVEVDEACRVSDLRLALGDKLPALRELLPKCAVALNEEFAKDDAVLSITDEIAMIPPVSGG